MIRIIHLSDFHQENLELNFKKEKLIEALINDLGKYVDKDSILIFSGDLIDKGGKSFSKKTKNPFLAFQTLVLEKISNQFPVLVGKIFFVPGNHDIQLDQM